MGNKICVDETICSKQQIFHFEKTLKRRINPPKEITPHQTSKGSRKQSYRAS